MEKFSIERIAADNKVVPFFFSTKKYLDFMRMVESFAVQEQEDPSSGLGVHIPVEPMSGFQINASPSPLQLSLEAFPKINYEISSQKTPHFNVFSQQEIPSIRDNASFPTFEDKSKKTKEKTTPGFMVNTNFKTDLPSPDPLGPLHWSPLPMDTHGQKKQPNLEFEKTLKGEFSPVQFDFQSSYSPNFSPAHDFEPKNEVAPIAFDSFKTGTGEFHTLGFNNPSFEPKSLEFRDTQNRFSTNSVSVKPIYLEINDIFWGSRLTTNDFLISQKKFWILKKITVEIRSKFQPTTGKKVYLQ
jgi:hypothetical protein